MKNELNTGIFILIIQILLVRIISLFPSFVTEYYTNYIYINLSSFQRLFFSRVKFNVGDFIYLILFFAIIYIIFFLIKNKLKSWKIVTTLLLVVLNSLFFVFHLFWGLNYYKKPFLEQFNIEKIKGNNDDLFELTEMMIFKVNMLREQTNEDEKGVFKNSQSYAETTEIVKQSYSNLEEQLNLNKFESKPVLISWYSELISYLGIGGYYNPFFGTAQVNKTILPIDYGMTVSHEIAHQFGFASEKEANYVAYLNGVYSDNSDLKYSVYYNTIWRLLYEVYKIDFNRYEEYKLMISDKVYKDRAADKEYYKKYRGELSNAFSKANNLYLKANGQAGVESYSYYVQLVLNQYLLDKKNGVIH